MTTQAAITVTARIESDLKISVVVGIVNLSGRISRRWLIDGEKCSKRVGGNENLANKMSSPTATVATLVLVKGLGR